MFGKNKVYCDGVMAAMICDDRLFVKPTAAGRASAGDVEESPPYPGAKRCLVIAPDRWDDAEWLAGLVRTTVAALPPPKLKGRRP